MAFNPDESRYTFLSKMFQKYETAVVDKNAISASNAGNGTLGIDFNTWEWFRSNGSSWQKVGDFTQLASNASSSSTRRASISARANLYNFDETNITKVKEVEAKNSSNCHVDVENQDGSDALIYVMRGTWVYRSTNSSVPRFTVTLPTRDRMGVSIPYTTNGMRKMITYRLKDKRKVEVVNWPGSSTSFVVDTSGVTPYSGRDGSTTYYWYVVKYELVGL